MILDFPQTRWVYYLHAIRKKNSQVLFHCCNGVAHWLSQSQNSKVYSNIQQWNRAALKIWGCFSLLRGVCEGAGIFIALSDGNDILLSSRLFAMIQSFPSSMSHFKDLFLSSFHSCPVSSPIVLPWLFKKNYLFSGVFFEDHLRVSQIALRFINISNKDIFSRLHRLDFVFHHSSNHVLMISMWVTVYPKT